MISFFSANVIRKYEVSLSIIFVLNLFKKEPAQPDPTQYRLKHIWFSQPIPQGFFFLRKFDFFFNSFSLLIIHFNIFLSYIILEKLNIKVQYKKPSAEKHSPQNDLIFGSPFSIIFYSMIIVFIASDAE